MNSCDALRAMSTPSILQLQIQLAQELLRGNGIESTTSQEPSLPSPDEDQPGKPQAKIFS